MTNIRCDLGFKDHMVTRLWKWVAIVCAVLTETWLQGPLESSAILAKGPLGYFAQAQQNKGDQSVKGERGSETEAETGLSILWCRQTGYKNNHQAGFQILFHLNIYI